jgi:SAM-dependent methyltransferase
METSNNQAEWWENQGGFFGSQYMLGDDSIEGYIPGTNETLEERTKREVDGIIKLLNPSKYGMLDIPCGYGRHTIELAKRGFRVIGIDINDEHIQRARKNMIKFLSEKRKKDRKDERWCGFLEGDMRQLQAKEYKEAYETIINMFYSFGFFKTEEENKAVMKGFHNALVPGGQLLLHTDVSPEIISQGDYRFSERRRLRNGGQLQIEENYDPKTKRMNGTWTILNNGTPKKLSPYSVRIYSQEEFKEMAKNCGFRQIDFYGSFEGEKFSLSSKEMIMIAKK